MNTVTRILTEAEDRIHAETGVHMTLRIETVHIKQSHLDAIVNTSRAVNKASAVNFQYSRITEAARARQMAAGIIKAVYPKITLDKIAASLGVNRNHATIISMLTNFDNFYKQEEGYRQMVHTIIKEVQAKTPLKITI